MTFERTLDGAALRLARFVPPSPLASHNEIRAWVQNDNEFDSLRSNPRFRALIESLAG